ncbi:MAG: hypothetical protein GKS03_01220 [Alphaproteobacteria bacterium]|nr:hypothetical protein [Alphaproteobacteria bacterium]
MAIEPTIESALTAQRSNFLNKIGNSAQGSQSANNQTAVNNVADQVRGHRDDDEDERRSSPPQGRGGSLDISI